jgi:hypothetical protein
VQEVGRCRSSRARREINSLGRKPCAAVGRFGFLALHACFGCGEDRVAARGKQFRLHLRELVPLHVTCRGIIAFLSAVALPAGRVGHDGRTRGSDVAEAELAQLPGAEICNSSFWTDLCLPSPEPCLATWSVLVTRPLAATATTGRRPSRRFAHQRFRYSRRGWCQLPAAQTTAAVSVATASRSAAHRPETQGHQRLPQYQPLLCRPEHDQLAQHVGYDDPPRRAFASFKWSGGLVRPRSVPWPSPGIGCLLSRSGTGPLTPGESTPASSALLASAAGIC